MAISMMGDAGENFSQIFAARWSMVDGSLSDSVEGRLHHIDSHVDANNELNDDEPPELVEDSDDEDDDFGSDEEEASDDEDDHPGEADESISVDVGLWFQPSLSYDLCI